MRDDSGHDLKGHESDDEREGDGQVASVGVDTEAMRMIVTVVVTLISGVVVRFLRRHHNLDLIDAGVFLGLPPDGIAWLVRRGFGNGRHPY
jgi:hypothetical protein